ncbi:MULTISPECIES: universal stress protein [Maritimibacter]|jgi:nucleotide-binding universal stress UspA family protein|uniref:Universal stress protein family protein n=1 Tax=Maritimibacter alkaliphilus HTCC2654 TaxID=314271 RepID=A3VER3_9RHOB|nr:MULTISPECIES: universal stress protein [Maritimibacter]EAQ13401.1 universal stress protein family protein [Rhodobacterales bacterium HTCC2654] [Maritimibacter alkaliphilus HTCC2654]TYP85180.1 nucleotide-binding universal stress UspA family protein [Maritimibacter alkaliphilus HTCC2654]
MKAFRTVTTVLTDPKDSASAFDAAQKIAAANEAHLDVLCLGLDRTQPGFYYAGATAVVMQDSLDQAREDALAIEDMARKTLAGSTFNWSATGLSAQMVAVNQLIAHRTRFSDLVVLPQPYSKGRGHDMEAISEAAMFEGDVPVLIQPDGHSFPDKADRILIGWNESREALRAVKAALPFLKAASTVNIAIIDPPKHGPERSDPGGQLSQFLARHGVKAELSVLSKTMPRVADVLARHGNDIDADMIVMGAYSHSRFRESILGGATRNMLELTERPLLLMH